MLNRPPAAVVAAASRAVRFRQSNLRAETRRGGRFSRGQRRLRRRSKGAVMAERYHLSRRHIYDCMKNPDETVVFDKPAGRFILLNLKSQVSTELTTADVATAADRMQQVAAKKSDPLLKFLADPKFQERFDSSGRELTLDSLLVSYRLTLSPQKSPALVEQYRDFSDWYSRLNALTAPTSWPPQARMAINAALADHKAIASQIIRTVSSGESPGGQRTVVRSEHCLFRPLTAADLERVKQSREEMSTFKAVSFEQYRKLTPR